MERKKTKSAFINAIKNIYVLVFAVVLIATTVIISNMISTYRLRHSYSGLKEENGYPVSDYNSEDFYRDEYNFLNYNDPRYNCLRGIDVSEYQSEIDWQAAKESGVQFAIIRLGFSSYANGSLHLDKYFEENIKGAKKAGLRVGVYFFSQAINADEAIEEANFVLKNIRGKGVDMPVAFDMEEVTESDDRIKNLTMLQKTEIADAFCTIIKNTGYNPVIYGNPSWIYASYNLSLLSHHPIWLAHYTDMTGFPYEYIMWQYSSTGNVGGVSTPCDLDLYFEKR